MVEDPAYTRLASECGRACNSMLRDCWTFVVHHAVKEVSLFTEYGLGQRYLARSKSGGMALSCGGLASYLLQ